MNGCFFTDSKAIYCTSSDVSSHICSIQQDIETEIYVMASPKDDTVTRFEVSAEREVKFLPKLIGATFANLKVFEAGNCGLTIVRNFYFQNMQNLQLLDLSENQIALIERESFRDLVTLKALSLDGNQIKTLDGKLFATMVDLRGINLSNNKIEFLESGTFKIPGGVLEKVDLYGNICVYGFYHFNLDHLESHLAENCALKESSDSPGSATAIKNGQLLIISSFVTTIWFINKCL